MKRFLAPHEAAVLAGDVRVVLCSDVDGELDEKTLSRALVHLQTCYPLLAGRFTTTDDRPLVQVDDAGPMRLALGSGTRLEEEINTSLSWTDGPLLRITLLREQPRARVVMTLPRTFVDGMSYLAVHRRLWEIYAALRQDEPVPADVVQPVLGLSLDELLADLFSAEQLREFVEQRACLDAATAPAILPPLASVNGGPGPDPALRIIQVKTDISRTATLAQLAHESSLTVNALASGILLASLRSLLGPPTGLAMMLCTSAVDMRRRLQPSIPAEVLQSAATTTSMRLEIDVSATPVDIGRDVSRQLRAGLDSGAAAMELAAFPYMIDQHPPTLVITNLGIITEPALPKGLTISGVRLAPLGHLPMIFAVVSRYRQRLAIELTYSTAWYTDAQIQDLAARTSAVLNELTT
jgi:phenolphthiocerol/phthiocerol/phthiodiolone dimycocerosyl transferase